MKHITKTQAPESLIKYKRTSYATYQNLPLQIKDELKQFLIEEQGAICCYCGREIAMSGKNSSNIEHFKSRTNYPKLQLEYTNLLASCTYAEKRKAQQYPLSCNAKKDNKDININPTDLTCENCFRYDDVGNIFGTSDDAKQTIEILNLNNSKLKNCRKAAIEEYSYYDHSVKEWQEELYRIINKRSDGTYLPFCFVVKYYIENEKLYS